MNASGLSCGPFLASGTWVTMDSLSPALPLWLIMLHSICQSSFQAQRSSRGPDVGFDRVWLVNFPSQRGARTPWQRTFFNPRFQHHCSKFGVVGMRRSEAQGVEASSSGCEPEILQIRLGSVWICSLKMTQCPIWFAPRALLSSDALAQDSPKAKLYTFTPMSLHSEAF